jgi:Uma2 family endonuclease
MCGEVQLHDEKRDIMLNPSLIVEVLSPSTEAFDRGMKFQRYREIESLHEYTLIAQDKPPVDRVLHQENGLWQFSDARGLDASLNLSSIGCKLALAEVYERIDFDSEEA